MPAPVSEKQRRYMHAIMNSSSGTSKRGDRAPRSVASQYTSEDNGKELTESKGKEHEGGKWDDKKSHAHHEKHGEKKKKKDKDLKKAFEQYYRGQGAGMIVVNKKGQILVGEDKETGQLTTPGGHVDPGEDFLQAAIRETKEEAGIDCIDPIEIGAFRSESNDSKVFVCYDFEGKPKNTKEVSNWRFVDKHLLADESNMRFCSKQGLMAYFKSHLVKSTALKDMLAMEALEKNILRGPSGKDAVHAMSHGDALQLVGNGTFRMLKEAVAEMKDEDFKDIKIDNYTLSIRKHQNDIYSGRVNDGHKMIHQFTNRSLPEVCAQLMSVFEWYLPEDEGVFEIIDHDKLTDDAIHGGMQALIDEYKRHNISNIYDEVERVRQEIRQGAAVDLQQVEARMMKLFDKLEQYTHDVAGKHNELCQQASDELEMLEQKLRELQSKIDEIEQKPETVEAVSASPKNPQRVYAEEYMYLSKPQVIIEPTGRIRITFAEDWTPMEKENYLKDIKAKVIKKAEDAGR